MATYIFSSKSFVMHNQEKRLCMHGSVKFIGGHIVFPFNQGWPSLMCIFSHIIITYGEDKVACGQVTENKLRI